MLNECLKVSQKNFEGNMKIKDNDTEENTEGIDLYNENKINKKSDR